MPHVSLATADESISLFGIDVKLDQLRRRLHRLLRVPSHDQDLGPLFDGLPDGACQFIRLGYVIEGAVTFRIGDAPRRTRPATPTTCRLDTSRSSTQAPHRGVQPDRAARPSHRRPDGQCRAGREPLQGCRRDVTAMSAFYRMSYAVGFHPWEDLADHQPFADALLALVEQEEQAPHGPPYGKALDLGCGSATWGVRLAARGWSVTGVDNVPRALRRARSGSARPASRCDWSTVT